MAGPDVHDLRPRNLADALGALLAGLLLPWAAFVAVFSFGHWFQQRWLPFALTVFAAAWLGGLWGGLVATVTATTLAVWLLVWPGTLGHPTDPGGLPHLLSVGMFVTTALLFSEYAGRVRRLHRRNERVLVQLEALFQDAPDGIFVADADGRYLDANTAGCRLLGASREEIVGRSITDLIRPELVERLWQERARMVGGGALTSEWELRRKDGSWAPVEVSARILPDGRWQGFVRDIGERKRLEASVRATTADLERAQAVGHIGSWRLDADGRELRWSAEACRILGMPPGAPLTAADFLARVHPEDRPFVGERWEAALRGEPFDLVHRLIVDRTVRWVRQKAELELDGADLIGAIGILQDVTERRRLEEHLALLADVGAAFASTLDYEQTLTSVAERVARAFADVCLVYVVEGDADRVKVVTRDRDHAWIGELVSREPPDLAHADEVRAVLASRRPLLARAPTRAMLEWASRDPEHARALAVTDPRSLLLLPLIARGTVLGVMVLVASSRSRAYEATDIGPAEEVAARAALALDNARLHRAEKAAVRARDEVMGIVAHDLRNPLGVIATQAALWLRLRDGRPADRDAAERVARAAARMDHLIRDLLDVTRLEAGRLALDPRPVCAGALVREVFEIQRALAADRALDLRLDLAPDLPEVEVDRDRMYQVFENLVANAIKFSPPGGRITIGARAVEGAVEFRVEDTGRGIREADLPRVFDRFWQASRGGSDGAGLGLPIVKGLVEAHGGHIRVESRLGAGTTFTFVIPTAASRPQLATA